MPENDFHFSAPIFRPALSVLIAAASRVVQRSYASGDAGHWRRLGPWITHVGDGVLDLTSQGGAANLSGIELWKLVETGPNAK